MAAHRDAAVRAVLRHYRPLVAAGHVYVCMPPLFRIDAGKEVVYALDEAERERPWARIAVDSPRLKPVVTRFKGLGEMNPIHCANDHGTQDAPARTNDHRPEGQPGSAASTCCSRRAGGRPARVAGEQGHLAHV